MPSGSQLPIGEDGFVDMDAVPGTDPAAVISPDELAGLRNTIRTDLAAPAEPGGWDAVYERVFAAPDGSADESLLPASDLTDAPAIRLVDDDAATDVDDDSHDGPDTDDGVADDGPIRLGDDPGDAPEAAETADLPRPAPADRPEPLLPEDEFPGLEPVDDPGLAGLDEPVTQFDEFELDVDDATGLTFDHDGDHSDLDTEADADDGPNTHLDGDHDGGPPHVDW